MADLGLDGIPGVALVDSSFERLKDGATVSRLTCRADDVRKLSQDDDSIALSVTRRGIWVLYRYRESYKLGAGGGDRAAAALFAGKRFRHRLRLPGRITGGNSDSLQGGWAVWNRPMFGEEGRVVMEAESRALNPLPVALAAAAAAVAALLMALARRGKGAGTAVALAAALAAMAAGGDAPAMGRRPGARFDPDEASQGSIRFFAQTAVFRGVPGRAVLEITYALPLDNLQFVKKDSAYQAGFAISALAFDRRGRQVGGDSWERVTQVVDYSSIGRDQRITADTVKLGLPPGDFRIKLTCVDKNSERRGSMERRVSVPDFFGAGRSLGGVRFERASDGSFSPWAQKVYGDQAGPAVVYLRLYSQGADSVLLRLSLDGGSLRDTAVLAETLAVDGEAEVRRLIPVDSLLPGDYLLKVWAAPASGPSNPFHRSSEQMRVRSAGSSGHGSMEASLELLSYIASRKEMREIDGAGPENRDSAVAAFWREKDPTPGTQRNEAREDFYQRVEQANRQYTLGVRPGWRTDRGRIFIKYGPPDEVERHPFEPEYRAYEVWYYYQEGVRFMFMDVHGFGDYQLMNTKAERK
jgi:GWxTD domain-containing protein